MLSVRAKLIFTIVYLEAQIETLQKELTKHKKLLEEMEWAGI